MLSKTGARLVKTEDGYSVVFDNTIKGREAARNCAAVGSRLRTTFIAVFDKNQNRQFVREKDIDQYERIQSFKDQCLIENIIKRCLNGDSNALNVRNGFYGDFTSMPTDARAFHEVLNNAKALFEGLTEQERQAEFGGSFENFLSTFGDNSRLDQYLQRHLSNNTQEVKNDGKE